MQKKMIELDIYLPQTTFRVPASDVIEFETGIELVKNAKGEPMLDEHGNPRTVVTRPPSAIVKLGDDKNVHCFYGANVVYAVVYAAE